MTTIRKSSHPIPRKLSAYIYFLNHVLPRQADKLALKIFFTPQKFPTPDREQSYKSSSILSRELVNGKQITVYHTGQSQRKVLLVHGWSGRATQFYELAPALNQGGFKVFAFTAPAHGSSTDEQTSLLEIIDCVKYLDKQYGPFEAIIGHSLGAAAMLNALTDIVKTERLVLIGAPGNVKDVISTFCYHLGFRPKTYDFLINHLKENYAEDFEKYSVTRNLENVTIPCLILHDEKDGDVDIENARQNHLACKTSELIETIGLGHRLILSDKAVIDKILKFLN